MSQVFISYARSTARQAQQVAAALRSLSYDLWLDEELPAHRPYAEVIDERLRSANAVVVIWSADAVKSEWVQSEADRARADHKLVQLTIDGAALPMPFDRIQCADLIGWTGDVDAPGWRKVVASVGELVGGQGALAPPRARASPPLPGKPSIAVLPFANLSNDPEQDYFADGMVEEIGAALSRCRSIFVIGSGSGLSFKGKATTPRQAAETLGVRYVLEGSVRKSAGRVRIAVKLTDGLDGAQIWAERFEDTLEDVFALQDRVALAVAGRIEPAVRGADLRRASGRSTDSMNSYDLVLRAEALYRTWAKADTLAALDLLGRALALDADYGWAIAVAVTCHGSVIRYRWSDDLVGHVSAVRDLTRRGLAVARDDPDVLAHLANGMMIGGEDLEAALTLADRAVALNPGSSLGWLVSGVLRLLGGEPQVAFQHLQTSQRLDPLSPDLNLILFGLGAALFAQRRFAESVAMMKQSAQLRPEWPIVHAYLAANLGHLGEIGAAQEAIARFRSVTSMDVRASPTRANPALRKLFLDGIDLAEGVSPAVSPAAG